MRIAALAPREPSLSRRESGALFRAFGRSRNTQVHLPQPYMVGSRMCFCKHRAVMTDGRARGSGYRTLVW